MTLVVAVSWHPPAAVTVSVYTPDIRIVAEAETTGLGSVDVNELGPVHAYDNILAGPPVRVNADPTQTGLLLVAVATGPGLTITFVIALAWHPVPSTTVRV